MKTKLTPAFCLKAPKPEKDRVVYWDESFPGFGLMVTASGHKSFVIQYRSKGKSRRLSFKTAATGGLGLSEARAWAREVIGRVIRGGDPVAERRQATAAAENTVQTIAEEYLARDGAALRSVRQQRLVLLRLVYPRIGARQIGEIRRSDIVKLLDRVADENGPRQADAVLAFVRRIFNWHAKRSDDFRSPIVRGMARTKPSQRRRQWILTDAELRAVWAAAEAQPSPFGRLCQFLLLTAVRRNEAARMRRDEVEGDEWVVPAARYKTGAELLIPLSPAALAVLERTPQVGAFVFTNDGRRPLSGFSKGKAAFDAVCGVKGWTLHDLRRSARSLMSRAGVSSDVAEMCLGHVLGAVRQTYDRHSYAAEKRLAFEKLAGLISRIVDPQANVVSLPDAGRAARKGKKSA
jgi:integrase